MSLQSPDDLVDLDEVDSLFSDLDAEASGPLLDAAIADTNEWTERLLGAWERGDAAEQSNARHSLKGICGFFGMAQLLDRCSGDLAGADSQNDLRDCRDASLAALRAAVSSLQ